MIVSRRTSARRYGERVEAIDKRSPVQLSVQLAAVLRAEIESGQYASGETLPSEVALIELHDVSRNTVRRAYQLLQAEGLVIALPRRGYIVA